MSEHRQNNSEPDSVLSPADHGRLAAPEEQNRKVKMENELAESIGERKDLCELQRVADRAEPLKKQRFVKVTGQTVALDGGSAERARQAAGFKGYVTNIDPAVMDGHAVVTAYHDLWRVEQSFRMAKSHLKARLISHRTRDSIEAHLTIVFTARAIARYLQNRTGMSIEKIVRTLRRIHTVVIDVDGHELTVRTRLDDDAPHILTAIPTGH